MVVWSSLSWGEDFLTTFASRVVRDLPTIYQAAFRKSTRVHWASACSGTESPLWVFEALAANGYLCHRHVFSAEINPHKRRWIRHVAPSTGFFLFADIFDISRRSAKCDIHGDVAPGDLCDALDIFLAGFSCKDVSTLNIHRGSASTCTDTHTGSTGQTLLGVLLVVEMRRPKTFVLENVLGLLARGQIARVVQRLESKGYIVIWRVQNAQETGVPQDRDRVWILGWRLDTVVGGISAAEFAEQMAKLWEDLLYVQEPAGGSALWYSLADLDTFLFAEDSDFIKGRRDKQCADFERRQATIERPTKKRRAADDAAAGGASEPKWLKKQMALYEAAQVLPSTTSWESWMLDACPEYAVLPDRTKEMVDVVRVALPTDPRRLVVRLDQSRPGLKEACVPTITPGCCLWLAHRGRLLLSREKLALQAIHVSEATVAEFGERLVADLAGNAFCATSCLVAVVVALAGLRRVESGDAVGMHGFDPFVPDESDSE